MTSAGECRECGRYFLNLALHQTEGHRRVAVMVPRDRAEDCRLCRRGDHAKCVGIACRCTATPRCRKNAAITNDRDPQDAA